MARGNDAQAAAAEFRGQYGVMGNAEDLIQANRAAYPAELRAAQLGTVDDEASKDLDDEKVAKALGIGEDSKILKSRIRGDKLVAVVQTPSGHVYKAVTDAESGVKGARRSPEGGSADEDAAVQVAEAQAKAQQIIAEARAEAERTIAEAREKAVAEASQAAAQAKLDADEKAAEAAQEAQKANEAEAADKAKGKSGGRAGGSQS